MSSTEITNHNKPINMKRFFFFLILAVFSFPAFSQTFITVSGTVTDTMTGQPIANHAVQIWSDSTGGFVYYSTVYTNPAGSYIDTIPLTGGDTSGYLWIETLDCQNFTKQYYRYYGPSSMNIVQDFQICVNAPCTAEFSWYASGTVTIQFMNQSIGSSGPWYWDFGDGNTSNVSSPQHTYATGGTYNVSLTIGDSLSGCWDLVSHLVVVADTTIGGCVAGFVALPDSSVQNTVQFLDQSTGNINAWFWEFGDGQTSNMQNPVHTYAASGLYNVCLTVQGADSTCYDISCQLIQVGNTPGGCIADFTYFTDSLGSTLNYTFLDLSSGNINSWFWDFGDGTSSTQQNPSHSFASPGFYTVCLTVQGADSLCYDEYCEIINVTIPAGCQAQFTWFPDSTFQQNQVQFLDLSTGNPFSWFWDFGDSTYSTEQNPVHLYQQPGTYYVCLTIEAGNTGTLCQST